MKEKYVRNLVNLWEDQDEKILKIAKKRKIPKAQVIREVFEIGLKTNFKNLK